MIERIKEIFYREISFFFMAPALVWQVLFFGVPLLFIITMSFVVDWDTSFFTGFTLANFKELIDWSFVFIILRSSILATLTACLCLLIGYPVAYYGAFYLKRGKTLFLFFLMFPFWTNFLVHVYAWFFLLDNAGLINMTLQFLHIINEPIELLNSYFAVLLVMFYCYTPFMILPLYSILEKIDYSYLEASADLGATPFQTFRNVVVPLSYPGIITGFFLVFVPAFGEFVIPLLLGGNKYMFAGGLITHYFLQARNSSMGGAFTCLSSIALLLLSLFLSWTVRKIIGIKERVYA